MTEITLPRPSDCNECGEPKKHYARGLCVECYRVWYYKTHPEQKGRLAEWRRTHKEEIAAYSNRYYYTHRDLVKKQTRARVAKNRRANFAFLQSLVSIQCAICGYNKCLEALDLHHTSPSQKTGHNDQLSTWLPSLSLSTFRRRLLSTEFQLLCANCHRELHATGYKDRIIKED